MTTQAVTRITDETPRAELEEAMRHLVHTLHRMPAHWTDRRAGLHAKIDALLEDWLKAEADDPSQVPHA